MTGPLYERTMPPLPNSDEPHVVPSGYWKIVCIEEGGEINLAAFIFDQDTPRDDEVLDHQVAVDELELRSGLDFFWELEDSQEDVLEGSVNAGFANEHLQ